MRVKVLYLCLFLAFLFISLPNASAQWDYKPVEDTSFVSKKFRIEASAGYSLRVGSIRSTGSPEFDDYLSSLKYGMNYIISIGYKMLGDNSGLSFDYQSFNKSIAGDSIEVPGFGRTNLKDNVVLDYYGVSYMSCSSFLKDRFILIGKFGLGWYNFLNEKEASGSGIKIESSALGYYTYISGEYNITDFFCVGLSVNYVVGTWREFTINGTQNNDLGEESGTRWDFNLGLRYYF